MVAAANGFTTATPHALSILLANLARCSVSWCGVAGVSSMTYGSWLAKPGVWQRRLQHAPPAYLMRVARRCNITALAAYCSTKKCYGFSPLFLLRLRKTGRRYARYAYAHRVCLDRHSGLAAYHSHCRETQIAMNITPFVNSDRASATSYSPHSLSINSLNNAYDMSDRRPPVRRRCRISSQSVRPQVSYSLAWRGWLFAARIVRC